MSYSGYEKSNDDGAPVDLYEFRLGNTYWRYTSGDDNVTIASHEYTAIAISNGGYTQGGSDQNDLEISIEHVSAVAELFKIGAPSGKLFLTIREYHIGDPDTEAAIQWLGSVTNSVREDDATVKLACRSIGGTYDRNGLRLPWSRTCPHILYGIGCGVDKTLHAYSRSIATLTGNSFTCTTHAEPSEGSFSGGFVEWDRGDGTMDRRAIEKQTGNDFLLIGSTIGMSEGLGVTIYPGCARSTAICKLFDNLPNYGGFPHMPGKSPFDGTPIF